eukprot:TRINITY_DN103237_c0_g1_i1.p1 TRINITY_DN103237_c0_g1~~TRINITY_DN103237_c0_g1_i1.p1  ORF type:complete len:325 (-),score=26.75 TRINITY_DN103237_c0_g1_i1:1089-2063(-)
MPESPTCIMALVTIACVAATCYTYYAPHTRMKNPDAYACGQNSSRPASAVNLALSNETVKLRAEVKRLQAELQLIRNRNPRIGRPWLNDPLGAYNWTSSPTLVKQAQIQLAAWKDSKSYREFNGQMGQTGAEYVFSLLLDRCLENRCNTLIWGVGLDSDIYGIANWRGSTVFLEHNKEWFTNVTRLLPNLTVYQVRYNTKRANAMALLQNQTTLLMALPHELMKPHWDVILVDAPPGAKDHQPGRMQSIYTSAVLGWSALKLGKKRVDVLVHDAERKVEDLYAKTFLNDINCISSGWPSKAGLLKHFVLDKHAKVPSQTLPLLV